MLFVALLILIILALGLCLYLELDEMALGAFAGVVLLASVGLALDLAALMTLISLLGIGMAVGLGYVFYRLARRRRTRR